jgi:hypothetical protein
VWAALLLACLALPQVAQGLITIQPDLTPPPAEPTAVPAPIGRASAAPDSWFGWFNLALLVGSPLVIAGLWAGDIIRPDSFRRTGRRPATDQPFGVLLFSAFLIFLGAGAAAQIAARDLLPWPRVVSIQTTAGQGAVRLVQYAVGAPLALMLARLVATRGLVLFALRDVAVGALTLALAYPLVSAVSTISAFISEAVMHQAPDPVAHESLKKIVNDPHDAWVQVIMLCAVVGAPIVEEVVYRLMLQGALVRLTASPWVAVMGTSVLFAASHLSGGTVPWHALPALFTLSVALGIVHLRTSRLGPPIVAHMGFNALNVALALATA